VSVKSAVWRYVRIQLFVFMCGIVGPIFLAGYFASQPEPELKWMYFAGLVVTTVDVLIALAITARSNDPTKSKQRPSKQSD
jgi:hypothetical protein